MAKIILKQPDSAYEATVETGAMATDIREAFLGVRFVTADGEVLTVSMRDTGFELSYSADYGDHGFNVRPVELKGGVVTIKGQPV